jgi:hypothetical protein
MIYESELVHVATLQLWPRTVHAGVDTKDIQFDVKGYG